MCASACLPACLQVNDAMDKKLEQRMRALAFLEPSALEIVPSLQHGVVLAIAQQELRRLDKHVAPGDKLDCVVKAAEAVFGALEHARSLETDMGGWVFMSCYSHAHMRSACTHSPAMAAPPPDSLEARAVTTDDFLPVFILVVLRARVPRLFSTCEYIHNFHNPADMMGR